MALAGIANATSLPEALQKAYETNPAILAQRSALLAARDRIDQADAARLPSITLNGDITHNDNETNRDAENFTSKSINLNASQLLYSGGGVKADVRRSELLLLAERASFAELVQSTLLETVDRYTAVWRDKNFLDLSENNVERLKRQLQATRDRFEVGEVVRTDVAQAEARLARAQADLDRSRANLAVSQALYVETVGEEPIDITEPVALTNLPSSLEEAKLLSDDHPTIDTARFNLAALREEYKSAKAVLYPQLDLVGSVGYADDPAETIDWRRQAAVGIDLSIPLYQGGGNYARIRETVNLTREAKSDLETAMRSIQQQVSSAWRELEAANAETKAFEAEVQANEVAYRGVEQEVLVGQRTVLDVLDAEQELFASETSLVSAKRDAILATYELKAATGDLTLSSLGLTGELPDLPPHERLNLTKRLFGLIGQN